MRPHRALLLAAALVLSGSSESLAQHALGGGAVLDCDACHGAHPGQGELLLAVGPEVSGAPISLGTISRSCLRCHATASDRARQPLLSGSIQQIARGRYIGTSLRAGHPLGRVDALPPTLAEQGPSLSRARSARTGMLARGRAPDLTCATCHDPHRRVSGPMAPAEERAVCAKCHDPSAYEHSGHQTLACSACHNPHPGPSEPRMSLSAASNADQVCAKCHTAGRVQLSTRVILTAPPPLASPGHGGASPGTESNCTSCHRAHR